MLLRRIEVRNFCQHEKVVVDLLPGLIGVMGPCGSGKSNFVQAIKSTLTNDFGFKGTNKADKIRRGTSSSEPSFVRTRWRAGSSTYSLQRGINPAVSLLKNLSTGAKYTKTAEIKQILQELLGVSSQVVDDYVFVDQWEMFKFLSEKPAERLTNFAQLCGAAHMERLWQLLGEQLNKDRPLSVYDPTAEVETRRRLDDNESRIEELRKKIDELVRGCVLSDSDKAAMEEVRVTYAEFRRLKVDLDSQLPAIGHLEVLAADALQAKSAADKRLNDISAWLERNHQTFEESERQLREYDTILNNVKKLGDANAAIKRLIESRSEPPAAPEGYSPDESPHVRVEALSEELRAAEESLEKLDGGEVAVCPVCKSPIKNIEGFVLEQRRIVASHPATIEQLKLRAGLISRYKESRARWEAAELARKLKLENANEKLEELATLDIALPDTKVAKKHIVDRDGKLLSQSEAMDAHRLCESRCTVAATRLEEAEKRLGETRQNLAKVRRYKKSEYDEAGRALGRHAAAVEQLAGLRGGVGELESQLAADKAFLPTLLFRKRSAAAARKWVGSLESWREVVHREGLPRLYMQAALGELTRDVNANLADFGSPFRVTVSEKDLSFTIINRDGTTEPAAAKSGGESVVLAVAYRLAVSSRFAASMKLMVLDEPTAGLDAYYLGCLADVLQRVNEITRKRRQQVILITHDQRLERVFDQLIKFE